MRPNKTWEGFAGGVLCATLIGTALSWATPFAPLEAAAMSLLVTLVGFLGGLVMAAIKRDPTLARFRRRRSDRCGVSLLVREIRRLFGRCSADPNYVDALVRLVSELLTDPSTSSAHSPSRNSDAS